MDASGLGAFLSREVLLSAGLSASASIASVSSHSFAWTTSVPATASNAIGWPPTVTLPVERVSLGRKKARAAFPASLLPTPSAFGGRPTDAFAWRETVAALAEAAMVAAATNRIGNFMATAVAAPPQRNKWPR